MSFTFKMKDSTVFKDKVEENKIKLQFPKKTGFCQTSSNQLDQNIFIFKTNIVATQDIDIIQNVKEDDGLYLEFTLNGKIAYKDDKTQKTQIFLKHNKYIYSSRELYGSSKLNEGTSFDSLSIFIKNDFFAKNNLDIQTLQYDNIGFYDLKLDSIIKEIFINPCYSSLDKIYLQGKVLELLYHELKEKKELSLPQKTIKYSQYDMEALNKAYTIMQTNLSKPPTIIELAKLVKLNEFKLKYGFKKFFHKTPHEVLLLSRMKKAKELLESSEYSVSEVANIVGYKYTASFSSKFIEMFGIKPIDVIKQRKYYY